MSTASLTADEIARRGKEWYDGELRKELETPENIGKVLVIDIETGEWEMDERGDEAHFRARRKHPDHLVYGMRIGYPAAYSIGTTLRPKSQ